MANAAFQIVIVFDCLEAEELDDCFKKFKEFKEKNELLFTKPVGKLLRENCDTIAASFSEINNCEIEMFGIIKNAI